MPYKKKQEIWLVVAYWPTWPSMECCVAGKRADLTSNFKLDCSKFVNRVAVSTKLNFIFFNLFSNASKHWKIGFQLIINYNGKVNLIRLIEIVIKMPLNEKDGY